MALQYFQLFYVAGIVKKKINTFGCLIKVFELFIALAANEGFNGDVGRAHVPHLYASAINPLTSLLTSSFAMSRK